MEKLDKPQFEFSILDKTATLFGIIPPIITFAFSTWYYALIVLLMIFLALFIYYIYKYNKRVTEFYEQYQNIFNNHIELAKQFEKKTITINKLENLLKQYEFTLDTIIFLLELETIHITKEEKIYLKQLYHLLLQNKEYLYNLKGGYKNG